MADVIVFLASEDDPDEELRRNVSQASADHGLEIRFSQHASEIIELGQDITAAGNFLAAIVISPHFQDIHPVVAHLQRALPQVPLIFLAVPERIGLLQQEMARTPLLGTQWNVSLPDLASLTATLRELSHSTNPHKSQHTALAGGGVPVAARPPVDSPLVDSPDYRQLIVSTRYLSSILEHAQDAIISTDVSGKIATWNHAAERLLHQSESNALGKDIRHLMNGSCGLALTEALQEVGDGAAMIRRECTYLNPEGVSIEVELTVAPVRDDAGRQVAFSIIGRDITERKRAEVAVLNQQQWLEAVLDLAPTAMILIEPQTARLIFANRAANEMTGNQFHRTQYAGAYEEAIYCTDEKGRVIPRQEYPSARAARGELLNGVQLNWHSPEGIRSLVVYTDVLPASYGHETTIILAFQDISAIKQAQAELERLNRVKDDFLATVSHELRTPLNAISGWASLLRGGDLDAEMQRNALDVIQRNVRAQTHLIEDLLDISRIISGKIRLDVSLVDLPSVIQSAIETVRPAADAKAIRLQVVLDSGVGPVSGDANRLQQVVWNLLSNAVKFTPKEGRVQVRLERINSHLEVTVADNGPGIPVQFLPHIFDRFSQADTSITRSYTGLGLGLSIVRHLVELHGGTVTAANGAEGKGAIFTVQLPLAILQSEEHPLRRASDRVHPSISSENPADFRPSLAGLRILVVDDEPDARAFLSTLFQGHQAHVAMAASAAEALELLKRDASEQSFDVLVADIGMPEEDGYSLIRKVREAESGTGTRLPAVALTAFARAEDRRKALLSGFQMHIAKPVDPTELLAIVASLVGRISTN